jgi:hypothetical protein
VDHPAFGVIENQSGCDGGEMVRGSHYNGPLNLLGSWRIGIPLRPEDKLLHVPCSLSARAWQGIQGPS